VERGQALWCKPSPSGLEKLFLGFAVTNVSCKLSAGA
jgi:hypothetical protein